MNTTTDFDGDEHQTEASEELQNLRAPDWETIYSALSRIGVWGLLLLLLTLLRSFFLLIFLTFVFSYILQRFVARLEPKIPKRVVRVTLATFLFLGFLVLIGNFLVPKFRNQALVFVDRSPLYVQTLDRNLADMIQKYPALRSVIAEEESLDAPTDSKSESGPSETRPPAANAATPKPHSLSLSLSRKLMGSEPDGDIGETVELAKGIGSALLSIVSAFLLALLFSFLIVLDLPALTKGIRDLKRTRLRFIYDEVADSIYDFGMVLGRAFEAQLVIACANTLLTACGLLILGLDQDLAFLSVIVFFCSFIPVAGVFISSVPICLVALQDSGVPVTLLAVGMITIVHWIEAYILNPRIYGHHLRMNPVIVLIILTVAGKLFHVWGLVLGVPVCSYLFSYAIRGKRA